MLNYIKQNPDKKDFVPTFQIGAVEAPLYIEKNFKILSFIVNNKEKPYTEYAQSGFIFGVAKEFGESKMPITWHEVENLNAQRIKNAQLAVLLTINVEGDIQKEIFLYEFFF